MPEPPTPPLPVSGTYDPVAAEMRLTFDKALVPDLYTELAWTLNADSRDWDTGDITVELADPFVVVGNFADAGPAPPLDAITYVGPAGGLIGDNGLLVAGFTEFPLTLI